MVEPNALLARLDELDSYHTEISDAIEAGGNVLELEINEDTAQLRDAWAAMSAALGRAKAAVADLRQQRHGIVAAAAAPKKRNPIDDEG